MKLGIVSTIWKRERLTRLFLDYYDALSPTSVELVKVAVVSNDEDRAIVSASPGWIPIDAPNQPITDKHNAGAEALRAHDVDAVVNIPSDDFFTPGYFDFIAGAIESGHDAVRLRSLFFYSLDEQRAIYGRELYNAAGAMIARSALERVSWRPWTDGQTHATDACFYQKSERYFERFLKVDDTLDVGFVGVDFKIAGSSLNSFEELDAGLESKTEALVEDVAGYFPSIRDTVLSWNEPVVRRRRRIEKVEKRERALEESQLRALVKIANQTRNGGRFEGYWRDGRLKLRVVKTEETFTV